MRLFSGKLFSGKLFSGKLWKLVTTEAPPGVSVGVLVYRALRSLIREGSFSASRVDAEYLLVKPASVHAVQAASITRRVGKSTRLSVVVKEATQEAEVSALGYDRKIRIGYVSRAQSVITVGRSMSIRYKRYE